MASGIGKADGSIIIDTRINTKGADKGVTSLKKQFTSLSGTAAKLAGAIGLAFSVTAVVQFGKEASKSAREALDALVGLRSILEGQGRSFADAQQFINEYTEDGLIPATNAITAYKNLAMRGYDDSQIRQVMVALKDASAYGRQASYTMGEAVQSATEGLKNENSILVDNAGVTKNVAKMWEEYAASIGTTSNNLTQQQKIQAEVTGILAESKYQTGDAAKVANTLSGQLQQLSFNFNNLKIAVGNIINPFVQSFLPVINSAISAITRFANTVASVVNSLFGTQIGQFAESVGSVKDEYNGAAEGADNLAASTDKAGKAAKKALAGFDEITKISKESGSGSTGASTDTSAASGGNISIGAVVGEDAISPAIQQAAEKIRDYIEPFLAIDFSPLKESISSVGVAFEGLLNTVSPIFDFLWFDVLVPLATWTIEEAAPQALETLASGFNLVSAALSPLGKLLKEIYDSILRPMAAFIGENFIIVLQEWRNGFDKVATVFSQKAPEIDHIVQGIGAGLEWLWSVAEPIFLWIREQWQKMAQGIADFTAKYIGMAIDELDGLITFLEGVFTADWEKAWDGIVQVVKAPINMIIGFVNGMISAVVDGINTIIKALNKLSFDVPDWVPVIGGETWGFDIGTIKKPEIPYLAKGAVIPPNAPFMAVLGDQRHGTNIEAPLATIQEAVALVMDDFAAANMAGQEAIIEVLRDILEAVLGIEGGDDVIGAAVDRYQRKMRIVRGEA